VSAALLAARHVARGTSIELKNLVSLMSYICGMRDADFPKAVESLGPHKQLVYAGLQQDVQSLLADLRVGSVLRWGYLSASIPIPKTNVVFQIRRPLTARSFGELSPGEVLLSPAAYLVVGFYPTSHVQFGSKKGVDVPPPPPLAREQALSMDTILIALEEQDVTPDDDM
jgi:hypothetical protein